MSVDPRSCRLNGRNVPKAALKARGPITGRAFRVLRDWSDFQRANSDPKLLALSRAGRARGSASFAGTLGLHRRAWRRSVGAEHTAITLLRPQLRAAARAQVKELTSVRRHSLGFRCPAMRTSNERFKDHRSAAACGAANRRNHGTNNPGANEGTVTHAKLSSWARRNSPRP